MNKTLPIIRTCIISREKHEKKNLFRVVISNKEVKVDLNQNMMGRGCYIKKEISVILEAKKRHAFSKALKSDVKDSIYDELIQILSEEKR